MMRRFLRRALTLLPLSPTQDDEPDVEESGEEHTGASEEWGDTLREMREAEVSPELISEVEADLNWALAWHEFERQMQDEIDRVFAPHLAAVAEFEDFEAVRELVEA